MTTYSDPSYSNKGGLLVFRPARPDSGASAEILFRTPVVAICIDVEEKLLMKHGLVDIVSDYVAERKALYRERASIADLADDLRLLTFRASAEAAEELNKIINITGYVGKFVGPRDLANENRAA